MEKVFAWTEEKYKALEQRVQNELKVPWKYFNSSMTIIDRQNYDPINHFWHPVCEEDLKSVKDQGYETVLLMADKRGCEEFLRQGTIEGINEKTERTIRFQIIRSKRYEERVKRLYALFVRNHIPWQTVHMGYLERFFDLIPIEEIPMDGKVTFQWGKWEKQAVRNRIPLWNVEKIMIQSQEFRHPCLDEVIYEHVYYLGSEKVEEDGYLAQANEPVLSIRFEKNKVVLKTEKESLEDVLIYRLHQGDRGNSYGYHFPVLSNRKKDSFAPRFLQQMGTFIQTPMELCRKVEELSGDFQIQADGYEIIGSAEAKALKEYALEGDMNGHISTQVFSRDQRNILLFRFRKGTGIQEDYLYEAQARYILSQLQMEFLEYKCMGVWV